MELHSTGTADANGEKDAVKGKTGFFIGECCFFIEARALFSL
jgi:hypothetical protein